MQMKSIVSFLAVFLITGFVAAQSLELSQTELNLAIGEVLDYGDITATNISDETITVAVSLEKRCYNAADGLNMQLCWGDLCYPPTNEDYVAYEVEATLVTLSAGESTGLLSIHQFFTETYGSNWRIYFYDLNNHEDKTFLDVYVGTCLPEDEVVSVADVAEADDFSISPNPASDVCYINCGVSNEQIVIRDLTGRVIERIQTTGNRQPVQVADYQDGIYLVSLWSGGQIVQTQRLLVR